MNKTILLLFLFSSCLEEKKIQYPKDINNQYLQKKFIEANYEIYKVNSIFPFLVNPDRNNNRIEILSCNLVFSHHRQDKDTLSFTFIPVKKDSILSDFSFFHTVVFVNDTINSYGFDKSSVKKNDIAPMKSDSIFLFYINNNKLEKSDYFLTILELSLGR